MSTPPATPGARAPRRAVAVVALLYLAVALWALRALLPAPDRTYSLPATTQRNALGDVDQCLMIWATTRNARTLVTHPTRLEEFEECYPTPHAAGLGTPYFGDGILAVPAYLLGANPILTFNLVSLLMLWLSALAMFALAYHWTGHVGAAFVAGLAFGFHPKRILGANWPHIIGNQWSPLALLFTHLLFTRGRWRDALGLALFLGMQILASFYQLLPLVVMGTPYALYLAIRHRRRLPSLVPKLLVVVAITLGVAWVQFSSHLYMQRVWGSLTGHASFPMLANEFLPGHHSNPGLVVLGLALLGLADRWRHRRARGDEDPRLVYLVLGLLAVWTVVFGITFPGTTVVVPGFLLLFAKVIPGLDAVRGIVFGRMAAYLPCALLAAFGVVALTDGRGRRRTQLVTGALAALVLAEVFVPTLATRSFTHDVTLAAHEIIPPAGVRALYDEAATGPILELPVGGNLGGFHRLAHSLILAAFHQHPIGACYQPFPSPLSAEVDALAERLPDFRAADALAALGFQTLVVHGDLLGPFTPNVLGRLRTLQAAGGRLLPSGATDDHWAFRLRSPVPVRADFEALLPALDPEFTQTASPPAADVRFLFRNVGPSTYRHPDPIEPTPVVVRWVGPSGAVAAEQHRRALLPVALTAGEEQSRRLHLDVPAAGVTYRVTLAREDDAARELATAQVEVTPP